MVHPPFMEGEGRGLIRMEGLQNMTLEEKRDMLLEILADLYVIKAASKEENTVLDHKIKVTEKRLEVFGVTDLADIRP